MHNHDMPDYGLPACERRAGRVTRKNFYGATDDRTIQERREPQRHVSHGSTTASRLRNQTQ
jgi:catecholate siderophore receptor